MQGENYSRATLLFLRNGIERFLNSPPNNCGISLSKDAQFVLSKQMLDAKIKQLKKEGLQNTSHKPAIELEDLEKLKNSEILSLTQPWFLLGNVWFHISLFWCCRSFKGQRSLKRSSFTFEVDAKGDHFVSMTHDESTKNHPGGVSDVESFEKKCKNVQNQQQNRWLHWSRSFSLKIASWMRSAVSISQTKLAAN